VSLRMQIVYSLTRILTGHDTVAKRPALLFPLPPDIKYKPFTKDMRRGATFPRTNTI
jgi:hypothetical protein